MDKKYHMAIHVVRIFLYAVVFIAFLFLFTNFSNVEVSGTEYFSPQQNPYLLWAAVGVAIVVLVLAIVVWHIHRKTKHLEDATHERPMIKEPASENLEPPKMKPTKKVEKVKVISPNDVEKELARISAELKNL